MSTRSRIGLKLEDGTIKSIYCHFDGYLEGAGKRLLEAWSEVKKIESLLKLGNLSVLGTELGKRHKFDTKWDDEKTKDWCLAYGRDRRDKDQEAVISQNEKEFLTLTDDSWGEYAYLFIDGKWKYSRDFKNKKVWKPLTMKMIEKLIEAEKIRIAKMKEESDHKNSCDTGPMAIL
jgi:hypothetical protein